MNKNRDKNNIKLVFLHGFLENKSIWNDLLKQCNFSQEVYNVDLLGHGANNYIEFDTLKQFSDTILKELNPSKNESYIFVGHSLGGYIALEFLKNHSNLVEGIIFVNSNVYEDSALKKKQRLLTVKAIENNYALVVSIGVKNLFHPNKIKKLKKEIFMAKSMAQRTIPLVAKKTMIAMRNRKSFTTELNQLEKKAFIYGKYDKLMPEKLLIKHQEEIKGMLFYSLETGHISPLEDSENLGKILKHILDQWGLNY